MSLLSELFALITTSIDEIIYNRLIDLELRRAQSIIIAKDFIEAQRAELCIIFDEFRSTILIESLESLDKSISLK